jgi:hypothetical protein
MVPMGNICRPLVVPSTPGFDFAGIRIQLPRRLVVPFENFEVPPPKARDARITTLRATATETQGST